MLNRRLLVILFFSTSWSPLPADVLDEPPTDEDPRCLERRAAQEAYLKSIFNAPVAKSPCPVDQEKVRERRAACAADNGLRVWQFAVDGFASGSSMLRKGVPYAIETLGEPVRDERDTTGYWDIDVYEIPRTLHFTGVKIVTHDYINEGLDVDLDTATIDEGVAIFEMFVDGGNFRFAFGLRLGSSREEVERSLGLPCWAVANSGRRATRDQSSYSFVASDPSTGSEYSVTVNFVDDKVDSVLWSLQPWH